MRTFGLAGKTLSHSFSPQYFAKKFLAENIFDAEYQLFPLKNIKEIKELLLRPSLLGFNVTIPYKSKIIPFLEELDPVAQEIGSVNCVIKQNNKWIGYNTDVIGFEKTLIEVLCLYISPSNFERVDREARRGSLYSALVLGSGGASKAVCHVLKQKNIPFQIVSRKKTEKTITYNEINENLISQTTFIINTTPVGMFPHPNKKPQIPYAALHQNHILIDLIYNPEETLFLKEGKKHGAFIMNGLTMLKEQAEASMTLFRIFNQTIVDN